jgi:hypothetical protein
VAIRADGRTSLEGLRLAIRQLASADEASPLSVVARQKNHVIMIGGKRIVAGEWITRQSKTSALCLFVDEVEAEGAAEGFAAAQHSLGVPGPVELGWHAGAHPPHALCEVREKAGREASPTTAIPTARRVGRVTSR